MKKNKLRRDTDFAGMQTAPSPKAKVTRAEKKAAKKAAKEAILPIHKRPIVCPPDRAGRGPLFRLGGLLCRALVIWLSAAGLVIFIASALEFGVSNLVIFLASLYVVVTGMLLCQGRAGKVVALLTAGGVLGGIFALRPSLPTDLFYGCLSLYNAALDRLYKVGYLTYVQYKAPIGTSTPHEALMITGVCLLTVLISVLFTACFVKKVKMVPPAIASTTILVVMLTFNIYSNRIQSNLGITLVIVSFASMLVMGAYDRLYHRKDQKHYDTEMQLFSDSDRPAMPAEYEQKLADRAARKKAKAEMREHRREQTVTVEEELNDYFSAPKKSKKSKTKDPGQKKEEKRAYRAMMKQVRAVQAYDRVTEQAKTAMGGYAAAAVLLACLIAIAIPALTIDGNFNTIDAIDEKMELARNYVTALLRGDDDELDRLEYEADGDNFEPRSTDLEQLEFTGKQIFYLQSRYHANYYLRGWLGTDYEDGAWMAVDKETVAAYQALFGKDSSPSEDLKYGFYHYMKPELVDDPEYTENLLTKYKSNQSYGFVNLLVSLRRVNSPSTLTYFPATYDPRYGLMQYASTEPHELTFVNYFDGLYTGRKFHENGLDYATVAYVPVMKDANWAVRQASLQAAYNLQKEALLARSGYSTAGDGTINSYLTLQVDEQRNGMTLFVYTYKRGSTERIWRFYHDSDEVHKQAGNYVVATPYGILTLTMSGSKIIGTNVTDVGSAYLDSIGTPVDVNLVDDYDRRMTDEERQALMDFINTEKDYGNFVYQTYLDTSDSEFIRELAAAIKAQAHTEALQITEELVPDDPETPEDDSFTIQHRETVNVPADVSLAAVRNSSDSDVYVQRDLLVRNVIDYIIDEMGCAYTITPDLTFVDPTLDGVENFLRNTKEGYCVQFASAAALILRELGIPVRYAEGYVGNELSRISREDFVYGGYVRDYQAHAWIEVYFDGVGWIQYETTPQYYVGMYGADNTAGSGPVTPILPEDETKDPYDEPETQPDEEVEETDTTEETTEDADADSAEILRRAGIGLAVMAVLAVILGFIITMINRARAAEDHRQSVAAQILEQGFGTNTNEEDRRELALETVDAVMELLALYELSPKAGEFREDYAERLTAELTPVAEEGKKSRQSTLELPSLRVVLDGMAAEEFGHGMTISEMKATSALYLYLHSQVRKRLAWPERFKLRYFKRKI